MFVESGQVWRNNLKVTSLFPSVEAEKDAGPAPGHGILDSLRVEVDCGSWLPDPQNAEYVFVHTATRSMHSRYAVNDSEKDS